MTSLAGASRLLDLQEVPEQEQMGVSARWTAWAGPADPPFHNFTKAL